MLSLHCSAPVLASSWLSEVHVQVQTAAAAEHHLDWSSTAGDQLNP